MDIGRVTAFLAPFLPALLGATPAVAPPHAARAHAEALWARLGPAVGRRPAAWRAARALADAPDDRTARLALEFQLGRLLDEDPALAEEVRRLWQAAEAAGVTPPPEPPDHRRPTAAPPPARPERSPGYPGRRGWDEPPASYRPPPAPPQPRWLQVEVEDHDPGRPLPTDEGRTLAFGVGLDQARPGVVFDDQHAFQPGERAVELVVVLSSDDFRVHTGPQRLRVPREGRSRNKARFDVEPRRTGVGTVTASLYKDANFVQGMVVRLQVGGPTGPAVAGVEPLGRPLEGAFAVQPRTLSLLVTQRDGDYHLTAFGALRDELTLRLKPEHLDSMLAEARRGLKDVVNLGVDPGGAVVQTDGAAPAGTRLVYQDGIDIPPEADLAARRRLADVGRLLYEQLFYAFGDATAMRFGDQLRELAERETLKLQVVSKDFFLPFGLLYLDGPDDPQEVDPERFLGLRHIVEHIPLQPQPAVLERAIRSEPRLFLSLNVDADIDHEMGITAVADQLAWFGDLTRTAEQVQVTVRRTPDEVRLALADRATPDQILYFYCHAVSQTAADEGGPEGSYLRLSQGGRLTLRELLKDASARRLLAGGPLVFLNACGSAELSPRFYGGFLPYFVAKGARGMLGTECDVPAVFAAEWARRFLDRFLRGDATLGQTLLALRREFHQRPHNNLLGLVYALYCDADTQVLPGLGPR